VSKLFEPLSFGNLQMDNRIIIAPMCQYSAIEGTPGDWASHASGTSCPFPVPD